MSKLFEARCGRKYVETSKLGGNNCPVWYSMDYGFIGDNGEYRMQGGSNSNNLGEIQTTTIEAVKKHLGENHKVVLADWYELTVCA
jgi:hypothetical protein